MKFSQRLGYTTAKKHFQFESIDQELRNGLWNAIQLYVWEEARIAEYAYVEFSPINGLFIALWHSFFKRPLDTIPALVTPAIHEVREHFFSTQWHDVYDLLEFFADHMGQKHCNEFQQFCNGVLERENSAYRFVSGSVTPITSEIEIENVETAVKQTSKFNAVGIHLKSALEHLSDRHNPDYRNSIKESVSAVEAVCQQITGNTRATTGQALALLERHHNLHKALKTSFTSLYGYTSDADGIRHAMLAEPSLSYVDAKYMLVACAAFVNYLIAKAGEAGINVQRQLRSSELS